MNNAYNYNNGEQRLQQQPTLPSGCWRRELREIKKMKQGTNWNESGWTTNP
jgi:hypothetical protein